MPSFLTQFIPNDDILKPGFHWRSPSFSTYVSFSPLDSWVVFQGGACHLRLLEGFSFHPSMCLLLHRDDTVSVTLSFCLKLGEVTPFVCCSGLFGCLGLLCFWIHSRIFLSTSVKNVIGIWKRHRFFLFPFPCVCMVCVCVCVCMFCMCEDACVWVYMHHMCACPCGGLRLTSITSLYYPFTVFTEAGLLVKPRAQGYWRVMRAN